MYAIAVDGELMTILRNRAQVVEKLGTRELKEKLAEDVKLELASFDFLRRKWIPLCLSEFAV